MSIGYMWEVFYCGTQSMVTGTGQIQERLENTFRYLMPRLMGPQIDLTPELEEKAHNLMRQVSCKTSKGEHRRHLPGDERR